MVYVRQVGERELTFAVSGMLWKQSLVLVDMETKSLWSHLLGRAMSGQLKGRELRTLPAAMVTWKSWKSRFPHTTVTDYQRTSEAYNTSFYEQPRRFVLGFEIDGQAYHVGLDTMQSRPVLNLTEPQPHLIVFDAASTAATVFDRTVSGKTLTFRTAPSGKLIADGSTWNPLTGRVISGAHKDRSLKPIVGIMSFREAWYDFHPNSRPVQLP